MPELAFHDFRARFAKGGLPLKPAIKLVLDASEEELSSCHIPCQQPAAGHVGGLDDLRNGGLLDRATLAEIWPGVERLGQKGEAAPVRNQFFAKGATKTSGRGGSDLERRAGNKFTNGMQVDVSLGRQSYLSVSSVRHCRFSCRSRACLKWKQLGLCMMMLMTLRLSLQARDSPPNMVTGSQLLFGT